MDPLIWCDRPEEEEGHADLLVRNWTQGRGQITGLTFLALAGEDDYAKVASWLADLDDRGAFKVTRIHDMRRKKLPSSFPDEWAEPFRLWRDAQYRLEGAERGDAVKSRVAEVDQTVPWSKYVSESEAYALFGKTPPEEGDES